MLNPSERTHPRAHSENHYQLLFSSNPNPVWMYDPETLAFLEVNQAAIDKYGYSKSEFLAMTIEDIRPDVGSAALRQTNPTLRPNQPPYIAIWQHRRKDGTTIAVEVMAHAFIMAGKQTNLIQIKDLTALNQLKAKYKQSKEDLYASHQRIMLAWESMSDAYIMLDLEWYLVYANSAATRMLSQLANIPPETILGRNYWELLPWTVGQPIELAYRQAMETQVPVNLEAFYEAGSRWFEVHAYPSAIGLGLYFRDISDRKNREVIATAAIDQIREQASLLDIASDAIYVCDLEYQILYWSRGAERLYGWSAEAAIGQNATELLKENLIQVAKMLKNLLDRGSGYGEIYKTTQSGKEVIVDGRWTLVNEAGKPKSILIVDTDITEKKQLETQFLRAQRLESLGTLASGIAHDLNNVLTPIMGIAQLLPLRLPNLDEKSRRMLHILDQSAHQGVDLVKQVLAFGRGVERDSSSTQVTRLLTEISAVVGQTFPRNITLKVDLSESLWLIAADATLLNQVFMNLCVNANDAMPNGGILSISAENLTIDENYAQMHVEAEVGDYVMVTIGDTGIGIPPETINFIFDPFFTTKDVGKGTGLGLSTVIGIVKSHQGFVDVCSEVGKGTRFKIYLPVTESAEVEEIKDLAPVNGQGELILIVDDEIAVQEITQATLVAHGYTAITAGNGIEAIALYAQNPQIKIILLDVMMPLLDATTTMRILLKLNPNITIIAMSGLATNELAISTTHEGAKAFLAKPFTASTLLNLLSRFCSTVNQV
jgi:PAS domain S-box-containing protein